MVKTLGSPHNAALLAEQTLCVEEAFVPLQPLMLLPLQKSLTGSHKVNRLSRDSLEGSTASVTRLTIRDVGQMQHLPHLAGMLLLAQ